MPWINASIFAAPKEIEWFKLDVQDLNILFGDFDISRKIDTGLSKLSSKGTKWFGALEFEHDEDFAVVEVVVAPEVAHQEEEE